MYVSKSKINYRRSDDCPIGDPFRRSASWSVRALMTGVILALILISSDMSISSATAQDPDEVDKADDRELELSPLAIEVLSNDTSQMILRSVRDSNPQTPVELAKAAAVLMEVELYDDVKNYLQKIVDLNLNEDQLFDLQESVGSDFFSAIQIHTETQPVGAQLARTVLASATKVGVAPARMNQLIKTLNDSDINVRSVAFRKLRRLGEPAVAELLNVFAHEDRKADFPGVRGALKNMGASSQGPLLGGARSSNLQVQTESIRALGNYSTSESLDVMMRAYLSPKVPSFLRRVALDFIDPRKFRCRSNRH